jgi:hypothetical protein
LLTEYPIKLDILSLFLFSFFKISNKIGYFDKIKKNEVRVMHDILSFAQTAYIEAQNLMPLLSDYTNPRDFLARMVKKGELIRLKNGFFVIAEKIKNSPVPYEQIANLLYGPSYISLEWALSFYGMIPEGIYLVTSVAGFNSKTYKTPIGTFDYIYLNHSRYAIGIDQKENAAGKFIIATPEKALADLVHLKSRGLNSKDLLIDLIEARRIDKNILQQLNKTHLSEIGECYRSMAVKQLISALGLI